MNEYIKQLVEQCTVQEFSDCTGGFETFDKAKFAELIVRECADLCVDNVVDEICGGTRLSAKIKKHFGVEE